MSNYSNASYLTKTPMVIKVSRVAGLIIVSLCLATLYNVLGL